MKNKRLISRRLIKKAANKEDTIKYWTTLHNKFMNAYVNLTNAKQQVDVIYKQMEEIGDHSDFAAFLDQDASGFADDMLRQEAFDIAEDAIPELNKLNAKLLVNIDEMKEASEQINEALAKLPNDSLYHADTFNDY